MSKRLLLKSAVVPIGVLVVAVLVVGKPTPLRAQVFNPAAAQPNAAIPQMGVQQAGGRANQAQTGAVEQTGWGISMPKLTMPKLTLPKLTMPKLTMPSMASVTAPMKSGFSKVSSGTKKAWEGTKEMLTFGQNKSAPRAQTATTQKTSFWQRLIARPAEPRGPQTVGEFMKQPRIDQ